MSCRLCLLACCALVVAGKAPPKLLFQDGADSCTVLKVSGADTVTSGNCDLATASSSINGNAAAIAAQLKVNKAQQDENRALRMLLAVQDRLISELREDMKDLAKSHKDTEEKHEAASLAFAAADTKLADAIAAVSKLPGPRGEKGERGERGPPGVSATPHPTPAPTPRAKILDRLGDFNPGASSEVFYQGHPTAIKMNRCKGGGDAFSNWSFKGKIRLEYDVNAVDGGYLGFSEGHPGRHDWAVGNIATSGWERRSVVYDCPYSQCHLMLEDYSGGCGNVWFDNFAFTSIDGHDLGR